MSGIGHLGEIRTIEHVQKELGMEVYLPLKDKGIDFVAGKGDRLVHVQVKTSMLQKRSYFWFTLHKHKMRFTDSTFYVFVCHTMPRRRFMGKSQNFIVIPSRVLQKWMSTGKLAAKKGDKGCFDIFLYADDESTPKTWTYRNKRKSIDWTAYWNNFMPVLALIRK